MRWRQARRSQNIEDRRGQSRRRGGGKVVGGGLGTIVVALIAIFVLKQDPEQVLSSLSQQQAGGGVGQQESYAPRSAEEEEMAEFTATVLAYTEGVWDQLYPALSKSVNGQASRYQYPSWCFFRISCSPPAAIPALPWGRFTARQTKKSI